MVTTLTNIPSCEIIIVSGKSINVLQNKGGDLNGK